MTQDFNGFGLSPKLLQALARLQFTTPTPIQAQTLPLALSGRDILGSAQTGTGKTAAFGIPLIEQLMQRPDAAALIMTPTRELAAQVVESLTQMIPTQDIRTALLIGGEAMPRQFKQLQARPRIIVGTPGRINDHLARGTLKLGNIRFLVLDETDRMLDMGFGVQIEKIIKNIPEDRQTFMFSATMPDNITKLSAKYLRNPERIAVGSTRTPAANIQQELIHTSDEDKYTKLVEQLEARQGSVIIFVKTKYGTEKLAKRLVKGGQKADAIHGDLQQRRRNRVIQSFRDSEFRILVATDVAARGLDIPHIEHVINYDLPQAPEDYIHRIGRTARAGAEGSAVNFITPADGGKWKAIHKLMHGTTNDNKQGGQQGGRKQKSFINANREDKPRRYQGKNRGDQNHRPFKKRDDDRSQPQEHRSFKKRDHGDNPKSHRSFKDRSFKNRNEDGGQKEFRPFKKRDDDRGQQPENRSFKKWDKNRGHRKGKGQNTNPQRKRDGDRNDHPRNDRPQMDWRDRQRQKRHSRKQRAA
ncbi:MAG: DEAD/DEAH box helicase [Alphaproteobacteria bacterium]|nr:MAG: DEAD/DEAH box helicase [Alphaproteobacteria bacterium]